jgi:hypothetical protein
MSLATDRLVKNARNSLPGSLDGVILLELFNVLDQFFRESSVWTEEIPFSAFLADPPGTIHYIEPESVSTIVRLISVIDATGFWQPVTMRIPGEVTFTTPPSHEGTMMATVILSIVDPVQRDGFPEFPAWVLEKYGLGILEGILGRMMAQPAKPYTNKDLAARHLIAFRRTISIASTESVHGNLMNAQTWKYPQQFSTRSRRR